MEDKLELLRDETSKLNNMKYGVPQGGVSSPFLFILFINDIIREIRNFANKFNIIPLYADDTTIVVQFQIERNSKI